MKKISYLKPHDAIMVLSPANSLRSTSKLKDIARETFERKLNLLVTYSKHCFDFDEGNSAKITSRVNDIHEAFQDSNIGGIIASSGGFNSNELLPYLDWDLIKENPKPFIGSSDITVLINAIYQKTGVQTYFGPNYFRFGMQDGLDFTLDYFKKCLFGSKKTYSLNPSPQWSDDRWMKGQSHREFKPNLGYIACSFGRAEGRIIGGNLSSLNLLLGTEFMPNLSNSILCIEDDDSAGEETQIEFIRNLYLVLQLPASNRIKGILVGKFQRSAGVDENVLVRVLHDIGNQRNIPILANVDFGHTEPSFTFPVGGTLKITSEINETSIILQNIVEDQI